MPAYSYDNLEESFKCLIIELYSWFSLFLISRKELKFNQLFKTFIVEVNKHFFDSFDKPHETKHFPTVGNRDNNASASKRVFWNYRRTRFVED